MKDPETDRPRAAGVWLAMKAYAISESAGMSAVAQVRGYFPAQTFRAEDFAQQAIAQGLTFAAAHDWRPMTIAEIKAWEAEDRAINAELARGQDIEWNDEE